MQISSVTPGYTVDSKTTHAIGFQLFGLPTWSRASAVTGLDVCGVDWCGYGHNVHVAPSHLIEVSDVKVAIGNVFKVGIIDFARVVFT